VANFPDDVLKSREGDPLTLGEQAAFELFPLDS
jgi:hypothetical protein